MRKFITVLLLVATIITTGVLIAGSYVTYAEPISSMDIQNIYIAWINKLGAAIMLLQMVCLAMVLADRKRNVR